MFEEYEIITYDRLGTYVEGLEEYSCCQRYESFFKNEMGGPQLKVLYCCLPLKRFVVLAFVLVIAIAVLVNDPDLLAKVESYIYSLFRLVQTHVLVRLSLPG